MADIRSKPSVGQALPAHESLSGYEHVDREHVLVGEKLDPALLLRIHRLFDVVLRIERRFELELRATKRAVTGHAAHAPLDREVCEAACDLLLELCCPFGIGGLAFPERRGILERAGRRWLGC
jgi:hypothetical protein